MRYGSVKIQCDSLKCHAFFDVEAETLESNALADVLSDEGWMRVDGKDICPDCITFAVTPYDAAREERL